MKQGKRVIASLLLAAVATSGCTVIKPLACATVFPFKQFGKASAPRDPEQKYSEMPAAGVIVAAPVLIPLKYVYYVGYGAVGGLVSGVISDMNLLVGNGSIDNSIRTIFKPMRTNAVKKN